MPSDGIRTLSSFDAILLGAVGYPGVPDHISLRDLLLRIRHDFDEYINLRPVKLLKGASCPLKGIDPGEMQIIPHEVYVQQQYDILAATMRAHMDMKKIYEILEAGI